VAIADSDSDDAEKAKYVIEVLNVCPCEDEGDFDGNDAGPVKMIKCGSCRRWWHPKCAKHQASVKLHACPLCKEAAKAQKQKKKDGTLGFFQNDHEDLHKLKYKP
jgi:hypothetical protein